MADQRAAERFPVTTGTSCTFASPVLEDFGPVKIMNISTQGIGLLTSEPVQPGLLMVIKVVNSQRNFAKTLMVRVVHATPQAGGAYLVGGALDTPLTYEELTGLVM